MLRDISLTEEFKNKKINPCNHLHCLSVPSNVQIYVSLEETMDISKLTPLKNNSIIKLKKNDKYIEPKQLYIHLFGTSEDMLTIQTSSINYNNDEYLEIEQQDNQTMALTTDVTSAIIDNNIGNFSETLLNSIDKIINPYQFTDSVYGNTTDGSGATLIETICNFDKAIIFLNIDKTENTSWSRIKVQIDGQDIYFLSSVEYSTSPMGARFELNNIRGKILRIIGDADTNGRASFYIDKYILKG